MGRPSSLTQDIDNAIQPHPRVPRPRQTVPYAHKVVVGGNHDITLHESYYEEHGEERFHKGAWVGMWVARAWVCV